MEPAESGITAGVSLYPFPFTCAVAAGNVFAVQFHPEKSQAAGLQVLANFIAWEPSQAAGARAGRYAVAGTMR